MTHDADDRTVWSLAVAVLVAADLLGLVAFVMASA